MMEYKEFQTERIEHWNNEARKLDHRNGMRRAYFERLVEIYRANIPEGSRVLEVGCGQGDLIAALKPSRGVGLDFSSEMIKRAASHHPEVEFIQCDAHDFHLSETFDFIILSDLVNDIWDAQTVLENVRTVCNSRTRIILNVYSRLWEWPLSLARKLGLAHKVLLQNWFEVKDVVHLFNLSGFEVMRSWPEFLMPFQVPLLSPFFNQFLVRFFPFSWMALSNLIVARPNNNNVQDNPPPLVSVIVPARNEAGNIAAAFERTPEMGRGTELIFVEGHSSDNTYATIQEQIALHPERCAKLFQQTGKGKGDAVRLGFKEASGEVLMILDADLTMPPEYLPRYLEALTSGKGEFVNGVRLVYPMEEQAMRFFNFLGNKFFSVIFSWLLGQPVKDTLCGTKVLWKRDYEKISQNRSYFGDFDPFGDFDLLFGAARLNLKLVDLPIRYKERTYGTTNIDRWKHGMLLIRMVLFAAKRIKFI